MSALGVSVPKPEAQELYLRLQAPAEIRGRVVYGHTARPVSRAYVSLYMFDAGIRRSAYSDEDSRFTLRGLRPGKHRIALRRDDPCRIVQGKVRIEPGGRIVVEEGEVSGGEQFADGEVWVPLHEGQVLERVFPVYEGGAIEGRVVAADGRPVPGAGVYLGQATKMDLPDSTPESFLRTHPVSFELRQAATSDAERGFRVEQLWPREYYFQAKDASGHRGATEFFQVEDREVRRVEVTIGEATFPPSPDVPDSMREGIGR